MVLTCTCQMPVFILCLPSRFVLRHLICEELNHSYICAQVHYFFALMAKLILKQVCSVMGDMTAQMDQMNFNALLVNVTFKSDFFMKKVFLYNQEKVFSGKKVIKRKEKKIFSTHCFMSLKLDQSYFNQFLICPNPLVEFHI